MFYVNIALTGVFFGCLYALSATGLVVTYTATGVYNVSQCSIALLAGYLGWQLSGVYGWPLFLVIPVVLMVCGPGLALVLERVVFRPLQLRQASSSEKLVASLGVTVLLLAVINQIWGPGVQGTTTEPVPRLFGTSRHEIGSVIFDNEQLGMLLIVGVVGLLLYGLLRHTFLGTSIRAVVDRRELAELSAINSHRISQVAWALGCTLAAITGMIIPQGTLEPTRVLFFGIETFSVAVVARLTSVPRAIFFSIFVMGAGRSLLDVFEPFGRNNFWADLYDAIIINLSSILLFAVLVAYRRLDEVGDSTATGQGLVKAVFGRRSMTPPGLVVAVLAGLGAVLAPAILGGSDLRLAHIVMALIVIFVSIVCITGFSGHLTLGQASIAGLGAFATARAANAWHLPVLLAMLVGASVSMAAGLLAGYPAMRRKGLFLGLTTLGLALIIHQFVFQTELFQGGPGGLTVVRPTFFGIDLSGDKAFYYYELVVVAIMLVLAHNLRSGRLGRVLGAMRDSETAAQSVGIGLRRAKLFVFAVSAAMAGIGGAMLTQANQNWDTVTFNPVFGLFWFTAVVVCGVSTIGGGILAAVLYILIPRQFNLEIQSAIGLFGLLALFLGHLPGGLIGQFGRLTNAAQRLLAQQWRLAKTPPAEQEPLPVLTPFGEQIVAEALDGR